MSQFILPSSHFYRLEGKGSDHGLELGAVPTWYNMFIIMINVNIFNTALCVMNHLLMNYSKVVFVGKR